MSFLVTRFKVFCLATVVVCFGLLLILSAPAKAANPSTVSFQGKVVNNDGTNVADGTYSFVFKLYTVSTGGTAIWTETDSLSVSAGVFQVNLGASCPFFTANACNGSTPVDFNANPNLYLGITFNSDPAGEMSPRVQLQSVPFAYNADKVGGLSASQLVQLSPSGPQTGNININGSATAGTSVITPTLTASGALAINSGGANNVTIDSGAAGTAAINIGGTNATSVALSRTGQTTEVKGALQVDQTGTFNGNVVMTFTGTNNLAITSNLGGSVNGISFIGTPSTTAGTTNGLFVQQAASGNTNGLDNGLTIDNANTATAIGNAINITNSGGGGYTDYINAPKFIVSGSGEIYGPGFDYFDPAAMTGATVGAGSDGPASGNFGGVASTGAFIDNTDYYTQDFVGSKASTTAASNVGDDGKWYYGNTGSNNQPSYSDVSTTGGFARLTTGSRSGTGGIVAEGATTGTLDTPLDAANLPIIQMKFRQSTFVGTDDVVWGTFDTSTAPSTNDTLPTNGMFFWSNNGTGSTGWQGVVRSGGATVGTVTCPGTTVANTFVVGRIVVVNSTTVRFFIVNDASSGVVFSDCGTVTGTMPTAGLGMGMYDIHTSTTSGNTFDLDYARFWQDDAAPTSAGAAANVTSSEQTQANLSAASDNPDNGVSAASLNAPDATSQTALAPVSAGDSSGTTPAATSPGQTNNSTSNLQVNLTSSSSGFQVQDSSGKQVATVDTTGDTVLSGGLDAADASLSGGLTVGGDSTFEGLSTFQKLATFLDKAVFHGDVQVDGHLTVANDTAGYASLRTGESKVHVAFAKPYAAPPIVTATVNNGQFVSSSVDNVTSKGFDIELQNPATAVTSFNWTAVGVTNPQTATNPLPAVSTAAPVSKPGN